MTTSDPDREQFIPSRHWNSSNVLPDDHDEQAWRRMLIAYGYDPDDKHYDPPVLHGLE